MQWGPRGSTGQLKFWEVLSQRPVNTGNLESRAQVRGRKTAADVFHSSKPQTKPIADNRKLLITLILSGLWEKAC